MHAPKPQGLRIATESCPCAWLFVHPAGGNRYLSSDISYFGVGSKNAAFYLGKTVKVVSKTCDSSYVHELCIQGEMQHVPWHGGCLKHLLTQMLGLHVLLHLIVRQQQRCMLIAIGVHRNSCA
jgi:hypothetical protein